MCHIRGYSGLGGVAGRENAGWPQQAGPPSVPFTDRASEGQAPRRWTMRAVHTCVHVCVCARGLPCCSHRPIRLEMDTGRQAAFWEVV